MSDELADYEKGVILMAASYKARGWTAFSPPASKKPGYRGPAYVIIGSAKDGWNRLLSVFGTDRFARALALAALYNAAPETDQSIFEDTQS